MWEQSNISWVGGSVCFGIISYYKSLFKKNNNKKNTSLVHAQTHDLAKLWLHKNTQTVNTKKELHRIYTSELL